MYPKNLEEAIEAIKDYYGEELVLAIQAKDEASFKGSTHYASGMFTRGVWFLWWREGHHYPDWPKEKPALVSYFNELGINHPDDMSDIILTSTYRSIRGIQIDLEGQVAFYRSYWDDYNSKKQ